jgi:glycerol kinase
VRETTALGAAYLAGLAVGYWSGRAEIGRLWQAEHSFTPAMERGRAAELRSRWSRALERTKGWEQPE